MYKIQFSCNNCYYCEEIGNLKLCSNKNSTKYNKEIDVAGICSYFKKGIYWEEVEE